MKNKIITITCCFVFTLLACKSNSNSKNTNSGNKETSGSAVMETESCYLMTMGKDTATVKLVFKADSVFGSLNQSYYEKDSRKGTLQGTKNNETIKAIWTYMQEGMEDTLATEFKIEGKKLRQKAYKIDPKSGRELLSDTAKFDKVYDKVNCP